MPPRRRGIEEIRMKTEERFADNNFTALRLLLALMVVLGHFQLLNGVASPPWPFEYAGAAVDCFFVVSGYLVTNSFDRDSNFRRFYIRRFFRIYPLYVAVVAAQTLTLGLLEPSGLLANAGSLLRYFVVNAAFANFLQYDVGHGVLTGLINPSLNPSLWTLKIEFGFYLILPFLWLMVRRYGTGVLIGIFVLSASYYEALRHAGHYELAKQLPGQLQFFVIGMAAYRFRDRLTLSASAGLGLTIALALLFTALLRSHPPVLYPLVVGAFVIVAALHAPRLRLRTDISYGVYLLHGPIIQLSLLAGVYRPGWIGVLATVAATLLLAGIVERLIEAPGIALGKRLTLLARRRAPAGPAASQDRAVEAASVAPASPALAAADLTVVVLNDFCYVQGGASKVAIDEAVSLARSGVKVIFLGAVGPPGPELRDAPLTIACLDQSQLLDVGRHPSVALQGLWNAKAARHAHKILQALPRDRTIVHLHGYTKALTTSPVRIARRLGFPVICTLHDFFVACPNGAFFDYVKQTPCPRRALSAGCILARCDKRHHVHKLFRVARGLTQRYLGRFPRDVQHYISLSERSAAILGPYLPTRARLHRLPNVTDVAREPPVPLADNRTIVCIGRLDREKGVRLLAEVIGQLGLRATFVGDGPLRAELETLPGVSVTGWVSPDEVQQHLAGARCLVFPSLWYETYGLVVAEAAARGIPAIVSDISAAAERVQEGVTGWRFRSGDPADLARCLRLIGDDALLREAGDAAYRAFWTNAATWRGHADRLLGIYRSALQY
jgi:peptidoglycan/LPS O-acetylase OafA/YrhL/glycosyltransferase involved in cell wall biosynthesis